MRKKRKIHYKCQNLKYKFSNCSFSKEIFLNIIYYYDPPLYVLIWINLSTKKLNFTFLDESVISCNAKLDGVGPVDNRPLTDKLHLFSSFFDMWHVTCDMWHGTHDTWHMTHRGLQALCQKFRSLALTVWELWYFEDIFTKNDWLT